MLKRIKLSSVPAKARWGIIASCVLLLLVLTLPLVACASPAPASTSTPTQTPAPTPTPTTTPNPKPSGPIAQKWIEPQVDGDAVSIPVSEIDNNWNTRFKLQAGGGDITAMAYKLDGVIYVRADICPPCRSQGFSLVGDILDCDNCHTKFKASTGEGISGACVGYPKASVKYEITDGKVVMTKADLILAYQDTLKPG